ncbi:MAG: phospholipase D family protein [Verrucomicrobia bacterium]|nr:phospholipase D family protein [Verrucomicrobiota bacterium]
MNTKFIGEGVWRQLRHEVRGARLPCHVAVAYFGRGASKLLPLKRGSRLVVDASDGAVRSGQTCPKDLKVLIDRGVSVFSVPNLHAKVYVFGRRAFVGSANASAHSRDDLVEAMLFTTDAGAVADTREFVKKLSGQRLTPEIVKRLARLYRPPRFPGGRKTRGRPPRVVRAKLPRVLLAQLALEDWSDADQAAHDAGENVARRRRQHPRSYELDSFRWPGPCPYRVGDVVVQVTDEGRGQTLVTPPGNVVHTRKSPRSRGRVTFVYLERPAQYRRRHVKNVARALGSGGAKYLKRDGLVRPRRFCESLLQMWER